MSAMDARNAGGQDKIVSVLHAQLKRVHGRLARTEALLRDEREARRDAERQLRERDNGAAAPTRALVEEAVAKASKAAEERDRAVADATEGRQALRENELLKRGMSNLSSSFEQQEERLRLELEEMGLPTRVAGIFAYYLGEKDEHAVISEFLFPPLERFDPSGSGTRLGQDPPALGPM